MITAQDLGYQIKPQPTVLEGVYFKIMSQFPSGVIPVSSAYILQKQLAELLALPKGVKWTREFLEENCPWNTNYFDTPTAIAGTRDQVFIDPNSPILLGITPQIKKKLVNGGIRIPLSSVPQTAKAYSREEHKFEALLTDQEAVDHLVWQDLATDARLPQPQGRALLEQLVPLKFRAMRAYDHEKGMGIYTLEDNQLILRSVVLDRLDGRAVAGGYRNLVNYYARLVGVPLEVLVGKK